MSSRFLIRDSSLLDSFAEVFVMRRLLALCLICLLGVSALAADVTVTYLGHSCFTIQEEGGPIVMLDPYGTYVPYPALPKPADIVLMTHAHIDHCPPCYGEDRVDGDPIEVFLLDDNGRCREKIPPSAWVITDDFKTSAIEASHVNARGGGQGYVCMFSFEVGGIRFAHLGDLGTLLSAKQMQALSDVDVLFLPVGEQFTLDAAEAMTVIAQVPSAKIVMPMHYKVAGITPWPDMAPLSEFAALAEVMGTVVDKNTSSVVLSADALPATTEIWILDYER